MKKTFLLVATLHLVLLLPAQQVITGADAHKIVPGAVTVRFKAGNTTPNYIEMISGVSSSAAQGWLRQALHLGADDQLVPFRSETDALGMQHIRMHQYYKGIPVEYGEYRLHELNGRVLSANGEFYRQNMSVTPGISGQQAIQFALNYVQAQVYKWEIPGEEQFLKYINGSLSATYYPQPELTIVSVGGNYREPVFRLAYKMDIYAQKPLSRQWIYVDALNGNVIHSAERIHTVDAVGTAQTVYSGSRSMTADFTGTLYRLRESGRGNGIETYNMLTGTDYNAAVDFTDSDNNWNNTNAALDQYATDAHWGAEMTYDYYMQVHGRNSIDGAGFTLYSYVHYDVAYDNAFWDGQVMTYGDGGSYFDSPLTALDITGHEITHGLTNFTADLVYQDESGALNESFSDIFGVAIDNWARNTSGTALWLIGEETTSGTGIRNMSNPNAFSDPDTYTGTHWYTGTADNGGVHSNSGVQNRWFYVLSQGASGTNDLGNAYNVTGLGMIDASRIAFRNLTVYLTPNSDHADARFYAIQSATDIFGACSPEVISTTDAWYSVGVGGPFVAAVTAAFTTPTTTFCSFPANVNFSNTSNNASTFHWDFGDGNTSTQTNPSHTYTSAGTFTVKLVADGGTCGIDSVIEVSYIVVAPPYPTVADQNICTPASVVLNASGSGTLNWYASPSAPTPLFTGPNYTTPVINSTTTYYVENVVSSSPANVGPLNNNFGTGSMHNNTSFQYLNFDVLTPIRINSVWVNANSSGVRNIYLWDDNGTPLDTLQINIPQGQGRVNFNLDLAPGSYRIGGTQMNLYRNSAGASYPYTQAGLVSITNSSAGTDRYYYFYDWEIQEPDCISPRVPVTVSVGNIVAGFTEAHNGLQISFTSGNPGATSYFWNFGDGNTSTQQDPIHTYATNGTYTVMHVVNDGGCVDTVMYDVTVSEGQVGVQEPGNSQLQATVFPNPFGESVNITLTLPVSGDMQVYVTDIRGRQLAALYSGAVAQGEYNLSWKPGGTIPGGVYIVQVQLNGKLYPYKLVHVK